MDKTEEKCDVREQIAPLTAELVIAITELAHAGMCSLKNIVPEMEKDLKAGVKKDGLTEQMVAHYKSLVEVAGPVALEHFDVMSQMIIEQDVLKNKKADPNTNAAIIKPEGGANAQEQ